MGGDAKRKKQMEQRREEAGRGGKRNNDRAGPAVPEHHVGERTLCF